MKLHIAVVVVALMAVACDKEKPPPVESNGPVETDPAVEIEEEPAPAPAKLDPEAVRDELTTVTEAAEAQLANECDAVDVGACKKLDTESKWADAAECYAAKLPEKAESDCDVAVALLAADRWARGGDEEKAASTRLSVQSKATPRQRAVIRVAQAERYLEQAETRRAGYYFAAYRSEADDPQSALSLHVNARCEADGVTCQPPQIEKINAMPVLHEQSPQKQPLQPPKPAEDE